MAADGDVLGLLERMRAGDAIAVHQFYARTEPFLRSVARRLLNPSMRRQVDSVDIAASVFRRVLTGSMRARFENEQRVLAWLATIARNRIRTLSRKVKGPRGEEFQDIPATGLPERAPADPSELAALADDVHRFQQAMEKLAEAEQEVIALRDFEGLEYAQVAELMDRPSADAVRKLHQRALAHLRTRLGVHGP